MKANSSTAARNILMIGPCAAVSKPLFEVDGSASLCVHITDYEEGIIELTQNSREYAFAMFDYDDVGEQYVEGIYSFKRRVSDFPVLFCKAVGDELLLESDITEDVCQLVENKDGDIWLECALRNNASARRLFRKKNRLTGIIYSKD